MNNVMHLTPGYLVERAYKDLKRQIAQPHIGEDEREWLAKAIGETWRLICLLDAMEDYQQLYREREGKA